MLDDSDALIDCPYNKSHRVQKSRMQTHLFKCRKNCPSLELRRCPFNANHDIPPAEFKQHLEICPDRGTVQNHLATDCQPVIMPYIPPVLPVDGENWDCDAPVCTYDPTSKSKNFKVLRAIQGASKSERKNHRAKERLRFHAVPEHGGIEDPVDEDFGNNLTSQKEMLSGMKPAYDYGQKVREPRTVPLTYAVPDHALPIAAKPALKKGLQASELGLPGRDMAAAKSTKKKPAAAAAPGNGPANGSQAAGMTKMESVKNVQATQQASYAIVRLPSNNCQTSVNLKIDHALPIAAKPALKKGLQASELGLPGRDMAAAKSTKKKPAAAAAPGNGPANGSQAAGMTKMESVKNVQATQQASYAIVRLPSNNCQTSVNVKTDHALPIAAKPALKKGLQASELGLPGRDMAAAKSTKKKPAAAAAPGNGPANGSQAAGMTKMESVKNVQASQQASYAIVRLPSNNCQTSVNLKIDHALPIAAKPALKKGLQASELGLPGKDMAAAKSTKKKPAAAAAPGNGPANGSQTAGMAKMESVKNVQASQQASYAKARLPASNSYKATLGVGMPAPNLDRDFPALGRGRGRFLNNLN